PSKEIVGEQWDMDALSLMTTPEVTAPKPPPRQWPQLVGKSATRRIWLIALPTLEEVSGLIELAAQKKFGLCLEVPTELPWEEVKKRFEAALAEGNRKNVGVGAVLRLLRAASGMAGSALNQLGETGSVAGRRLIKQATMAERQPVVLDWLEPKHPLVAERLQKVADLPGLSQLLLTDTLYPIFSIKQEEATPGFARPVGAAFSYNCSVEERLAFLRAENMDPLDIAQTETFTVNLKLPWLNDHYEDELLERRWNDWRYQRNADSLQPFHALLQRTAPSLPVLVLDRSPHERFFALWEKPQLLPRANTTYLQPETLKTARSQSRDLWRRMSYRPNHSLGEHFKVKVVPDSTAGLVATVEQELRIGGTSDKAASWDGVALDLRLFPLQDALRLLKPLVTE
uniref:hypothetical protein n=1 Tax=Armatimonas sp. TaxID=1872638 RepID=UPI0037511D2A